MWSASVPSFTLNWLDQERGSVPSMNFQGSLEIFDHTVSNELLVQIGVGKRGSDTCKIRSETDPTVRICTHAARITGRVRDYVLVQSTENDLPNDSKCPSMEVTLHTEHDGFPLLDALLIITPLAGELDSCFDGFCTSIHWQHHVVFEERCYFLGKRPEI